MHRLKRNMSGSAQMAELAPVMFIFFLIIFFPLINLMSIGVATASGWFLNYSQGREAALIFQTQDTDKPQAERIANMAGKVKTRITEVWARSGIGKFVKVVGGLNGINTTFTPVSIPVSGVTSPPLLIRVTTTFQADPFLNIPFPGPVPGLNAPFPLSFATETTAE